MDANVAIQMAEKTNITMMFDEKNLKCYMLFYDGATIYLSKDELGEYDEKTFNEFLLQYIDEYDKIMKNGKLLIH